MTIRHLIHKLIWWLPLAAVSLLVKVLSPILGLFLAWFIQPTGELPKMLTWFSPDDTPAYGDYMFRSREGAWTEKLPPYLRRVVLCYQWSFVRNAGWGFDSKVFGIPADTKIHYWWGAPSIDWGYNDLTGEAEYTLGTKFILAETGHWNFLAAFKISKIKGLLISLGWNLQGGVVNSKIRNLKVDVAIKNTTKNGYSK